MTIIPFNIKNSFRNSLCYPLNGIAGSSVLNIKCNNWLVALAESNATTGMWHLQNI